MLQVGTKVYIYEDPLSCLKFEGEAVITKHLFTMDEGLERYNVRFIDDVEMKIYERNLVDAVATIRCACFEVAGDNPECQVHAKEVQCVYPNPNISDLPDDPVCQYCNTEPCSCDPEPSEKDPTPYSCERCGRPISAAEADDNHGYCVNCIDFD